MATQNIKLPFATSHAFIIGIDAYEHVTPLRTAVNDAKGIAERLESQHGYTVHEPLLNATKDQIHALLHKTLPNVVGEKDRVFFYFAGHGIALDGEDGPNGYLVPVDANQEDRDSLIPMNDLHVALNGLPCLHGLLVLDCCFSGAFKWSSGFRDVVFQLPKIIYEERFWRYCKDPAWHVITSSAHDQKAVDVISSQSIGMRQEGEGLHSPFAKALLEGLEGAADVIPAEQGDGVITASELYAYLRDVVESETTENAKRQSPSIFNLARNDKGEFIFLSPGHHFNLSPTPDRNPFMGLASYNEEDRLFYFGRDRVVEALMEKVESHSLIVVSGASGTGKSSVIKAGVLPQLRKNGYEILPIIRPGKEPMEILRAELSEISTQIANKRAVLVIDQYEELITQCLDPEDRIEFENQLAAWIQTHSELRIMLSIRSDFEPQFESNMLEKWWKTGRYVVPSFSLDEIREVITRPAAQAVLFYEPKDLVDKVSEEVSQAPGALPLLSFTLSELYYAYLKSGREDRALTQEDYESLGGVIGALRSKADEVYTSREESSQDSMRKLMLRMVSLEGGELAGKRVYDDELIFTEEAETAQVAKVATELVDARLVLRGKDSQGRIYLEPAHDALVRAWARLWEWIKAVGEEKLVWQNKLTQAVGDYNDLLENNSPKAKNLLWNNNPRLGILNEELKMKSHSLNQKEETFVRESAKLKTKKRKQLIRNILVVAIVLLGTTIAAISLYFQSEKNLKISVEKTAEAESFALSAQALQEQESFSTQAIHSSFAAFERTPAPSFQSKKSLLEAFDKGQMYPFYIQKFTGEAKFVKDGIVSVEKEGGLKYWDSDGTFKHVFSGSKDKIIQFYPSHEGSRVLALTEDSLLILWEMNGKLVHKWNPDLNKESWVAISPNGKTVLTADLKNVYIWDDAGSQVHSFSHGLQLYASNYFQFRFIPNSSLICINRLYGGEFGIWNARGEKIFETEVEGYRFSEVKGEKKIFLLTRSQNENRESEPDSVAIEDGFHILTIDYDGNTLARETIPYYFGEVTELKAFSPVKNYVILLEISHMGHDAAVKNVNFYDSKKRSFSIKEKGYEPIFYDFSPDGSQFLTGNNDAGSGKIVVWDTDPLVRKKILNGGIGGKVVAATFSSDAKKILSQNDKGESVLWDLSLGGAAQRIIKTKKEAKGLKITNDGEYFICQESNDLIIRNLKGITLFQKQIDSVGLSSGFDISSDGNTIVYADKDGVLFVENWREKTISDFQIPKGSFKIGFLKDNTEILVQYDTTIAIYNLQGEIKNTSAKDPFDVVKIANDGSSVYSFWAEYFDEEEFRIEIQASIWENEKETAPQFSFNHPSFDNDHFEPENCSAFYFPGQNLFFLGGYHIEVFSTDHQGYQLARFDTKSDEKKVVELSEGVSKISFSYDLHLLAGISNIYSFEENEEYGFGELTENQSKIILWNLEEGRNYFKKMFTYTGHQAPVTSVEFSSDGSHIISVGTDNTIHIWLTPKGAYNQIKNSPLSNMSAEETSELIGFDR